jgi:RNA polymerase sigma factor (sigma-70 family)
LVSTWNGFLSECIAQKPGTLKITVPISPSEYRRLSDEELVRRYAELSEPEPLYHLFDRYGHIVYGICLQYGDASGAQRKTEEIFTQLSEVLLNGHINHFKPWLYNYVHDQLSTPTKDAKKKDGKPSKSEFTDEVDFTPVYASMPDLFEDAIATALAKLSKDERKCIELFYLNDKNYDEIATDTGYKIPQIREFLHSGYETLKTDLKPSFLP